MRGKVLITGGFGNLGSWITIYLASIGYEVYILTREKKYVFENIKYNVIECDITNLDELRKNLDFEIDFCVHCASYNEFFFENYSKQALEINTLGTRNLLESLNLKKLKNFIYFSTFHVYGGLSGVINESSPLNPKNDYASTHLFAEYYVKQFSFTHNLKYTIFRLTNSYGAPTFADTSKWYLVLNDLVKSAFRNKEIIIKSNGQAKRDFIWMGDVVKVVEKVLEKPATNDTYNLSSSNIYSVLELAKKVQRIYKDRYEQNINIQINPNDMTIYDELLVENKKLKNLINFKLVDRTDNEIDKIFSLLEGKSK